MSSSKSLESKILRKQKRGQHLITNETKIPCVDTPIKVRIFSMIFPFTRIGFF